MRMFIEGSPAIRARIHPQRRRARRNGAFAEPRELNRIVVIAAAAHERREIRRELFDRAGLHGDESRGARDEPRRPFVLARRTDQIAAAQPDATEIDRVAFGIFHAVRSPERFVDDDVDPVHRNDGELRGAVRPRGRDQRAHHASGAGAERLATAQRHAVRIGGTDPDTVRRLRVPHAEEPAVRHVVGRAHALRLVAEPRDQLQRVDVTFVKPPPREILRACREQAVVFVTPAAERDAAGIGKTGGKFARAAARAVAPERGIEFFHCPALYPNRRRRNLGCSPLRMQV